MSVPAHVLEALVDKIRALPADRVTEVVDFIDFIYMRASNQPLRTQGGSMLGMPVISVKHYQEDLNLSREAIYGDDGR